ncbi:MAG: metallophosphoesterase [Candidatus Thorarchaeota archaeon]
MKVCVFGDLHGEPREVPHAETYLLVGDFSEYFDTSKPIWRFFVKALISRSVEEKKQMFSSEKMTQALELSIASSLKTLNVFNDLEIPTYYVTGNREYFPDFLIEQRNLDVRSFSEESKGLKYCTCINLERIKLGKKRLLGIPYVPTGFHSEDWKLPGFEDYWAQYEEQIKKNLQVAQPSDIVLAHNPPYGVLDTHFDGTHLGIGFFYDHILKNKPGLFLCGNTHNFHGEALINETLVKNLGFRNFEILEL